MSNRKIIQYGLILLSVVVVFVGGAFPEIEAYFGIAGLSILAAIFIWLGVDYYTLKKKYLGLLMIIAGLAVIYMMIKGFLAPILGITI